MLVLSILMVLAILAVLLFGGNPVIQKIAMIGGLFAAFWYLLLLAKFLLGSSTPVLGS